MTSSHKEPNMTTLLTRRFALLLLVLPFVPVVADTRRTALQSRPDGSGDPSYRENGAPPQNDKPQEQAVLLPAALAPAGFVDLPGQKEKVAGDKDKPPEGKNSTAADEALLKSAGFQVNGPGLLEYFRQRVLWASADQDRLEKLVRQLGSDTVPVHQKAARELKAAGPRAIPFLRKGNPKSQVEMARRIQACMEEIQAGTQPMAAARLLALRRPDGAAAVVLDFLPLVDDEILADELLTTLAVVGLHKGKADSVLLKALKDAAPIKRSAAALVLGGSTDAQHRLAVRPLLADADAKVRLRAALALAKMYDVEAIPVLIDLLAESPPVQRRQMEAVLVELAGPWAPTVTLFQDDDVSRRIRRGVWASWWSCTDGPALLAEFRKRTPSAADIDKYQVLVRKLHDSSVPIREQAKADLVAYGSVVLPVLWDSVRGSGDAERRSRVQDCVQAIHNNGYEEYKKNERRSLPPVAYRLLAMRKPAGAVEALLAYLPWAVTQGMAGEVQTALTSLAVRDGKVDPALVRALDDPLPARRALAAEVLAKAGGAEQRSAVRKLLRDADPNVRLRAAFALAAANEAVSIQSEVVMKDGAIEITRPKIQQVEFRETVVVQQPITVARRGWYIELAKETVPAKSINSFVVTKEGKLEPLDAAKLADLLKKRTPVLIGNRADVDLRQMELMAPGTIYLSIPPGLFLPEELPKTPPTKGDDKNKKA
jgi:HEAT repeat protein